MTNIRRKMFFSKVLCLTYITYYFEPLPLTYIAYYFEPLPEVLFVYKVYITFSLIKLLKE